MELTAAEENVIKELRTVKEHGYGWLEVTVKDGREIKIRPKYDIDVE